MWCEYIHRSLKSSGAAADLRSKALCLEQAIADSPCAATNRTCICTNAELTRSAEACVVQTCTIKESLSTKNYSMATCSVPWRDERWSTLWLGMGFFIVSVVAFALRMISRWVCETGLYWDDYFMVGAIISGAGFAVTSIPRRCWRCITQAVCADHIQSMSMAWDRIFGHFRSTILRTC